MTNVIFNSGFIGFLIWVLLFAVSTAALAIAIHCVWVLHKTIFAMAEFKEQLIPFLFLAFALMVSLLPLRVHAALPKELPTAPAHRSSSFLRPPFMLKTKIDFTLQIFKRNPGGQNDRFNRA